MSTAFSEFLTVAIDLFSWTTKLWRSWASELKDMMNDDEVVLRRNGKRKADRQQRQGESCECGNVPR